MDTNELPVLSNTHARMEDQWRTLPSWLLALLHFTDQLPNLISDYIIEFYGTCCIRFIGGKLRRRSSRSEASSGWTPDQGQLRIVHWRRLLRGHQQGKLDRFADEKIQFWVSPKLWPTSYVKYNLFMFKYLCGLPTIVG